MATKKSNKSLWVMLALIAAIIAVILLLPSCGNRNAKKGAETDAESTTLVKAGDTAPDFTVEMVDGSSVTLGDLKGKVVLLNFWATWCPPCRQELTRVQTDIIRPLRRQGVRLPARIARRETRGRGGVPRKDRLRLPDGTRPRTHRLRPLRLELHPAELRDRPQGQGRAGHGGLRRT